MFVFFSNRLGCAGSLLVSVVLTLILILCFASYNRKVQPRLGPTRRVTAELRLAACGQVSWRSSAVARGSRRRRRGQPRELLIRYGESVKVVQNRLGHASASETLDTYSHLWPDSQDRTRAAVDAVLGRRAEDRLRTNPGT